MTPGMGSLAIIPAGSGNDFIRSVDEKLDSKAKDILERILDGSEKLIDLASVNGKYFINISSLGFDAEVVYNTNKFKKLPAVSGSLAYILGILYTIFTYKNYNLKIRIDGSLIEASSLLVAVANGRFYGGGMLAAPDARIDDGVFDICVIRAMKRLKIFRFFPVFKKGLHGELEEVSFYKGKKVEIESSTHLLLNLDGEVQKVREAVFEIIPRSVRIVVPK
jgi:YegS/Rv2252/BmrU family lipid kinase